MQTSTRQDHLEDALQTLSAGDLLRIRRRFYAHESTIKRPEYLAKTIAQKVHQPPRKNNVYHRHAKGPTPPQAADQITVLPKSSTTRPQTAPGGVRRGSSVAGAGRLGQSTGKQQTITNTTEDEKEIPMYMRSVGISRSAWFESCVSDLGVSTKPPSDLIELRRSFVSNPSANYASYVKAGATSSSRLMKRYRHNLSRKCAGDSASGTVNVSGQRRGAQNKKKPLGDQRLDVQKQSLAEWKIRRFVEQGPSYLYHVWPKLKKDQLDLEYNGTYAVPNADFAQMAVEDRKKHSTKLKTLESLDQCEEASPRRIKNKKKKNSAADGSDNDSGSEMEDEAGDDGNEGNSVDDYPFVCVTVTPYNTLELKAYLSSNQNQQLSQGRGDDEAISSSNFLFRAEAACIKKDNENGVDAWIGIAGQWMNQILYFIRDNEGQLDSFSTDRMIFEKRYIKRGGSDSDPFKCTCCGNLRMSNNFVYVLPHSEDYRRGMYHCVICKKKTPHVGVDKRFKKPTPTWSSSLGKMPLDTTTLSEPPFKGLKPSYYM